MKKIIIAIDGYSSTGKSTVAKQLAKALGYVYVDTGAMYRAVTLFAMQNDFVEEDFLDDKALINSLETIEMHFEFNPLLGFAEIFLNGKNVEEQIRTLDVSQFVSQIATVHEVRVLLVKQQQKLGAKKGIVMDGRDIGTVVFPEAELKIFMNATAEKRAQRRNKELLEKGQDVNYEEVLENIQQRDTMDTTREDSPLRKADDAIAFDNSTLNLDEQFEKLLIISEGTIQKHQ